MPDFVTALVVGAMAVKRLNNMAKKKNCCNGIVGVLKKHCFIEFKWYHYDTSHFEYRPELLLER